MKDILFHNMIIQNSKLDCLFETNDLIDKREVFINNILTSYLNNQERTREILNLVTQNNNKYINYIINGIIEFIYNNNNSPQATNFYNESKSFDYNAIQVFKTHINNIKTHKKNEDLNNDEKLEQYFNNLEETNTRNIIEQVKDIESNHIEQEDINMTDDPIFNSIYDNIDGNYPININFNSINIPTQNIIENDNFNAFPFDFNINHGLPMIFNDTNKLEQLCNIINNEYKNVVPFAKDIINFIINNEKLHYNVKFFIGQLNIQSLQVFYNLLSKQCINNDNYVKLSNYIIGRINQLHH